MLELMGTDIVLGIMHAFRLHRLPTGPFKQQFERSGANEEAPISVRFLL